MSEKLFDTIKRVSADDAVKTCMMEYQKYLADTKLPHPVDGLKDVTRRAIYVMGTRKEFIKFSQFIAEIMRLHPHGDSSIQSAVERLFRTQDVRIPLIRCDGNTGSYTDESGAPRYLEVSSSEFARDLFFNGVHQSTIPMKYTVDYDSIEPLYFIPRLPNALLMGNLTIGLGFKSVIFPLNIDDVCVLVQKYIEHLKKELVPFTGKGQEHHFVPDFPDRCFLRNEKEIVESYQNGNFSQKVATDGIFVMGKHHIDLLNAPALIPFDRLYEKLIAIFSQKSSWINEYLKDFKHVGKDKLSTCVRLIFKQNVDVWKILPKVKQLVNFTATLSPIYTYETEGKLITLTPPEVIKYWYTARYGSIVNGLNADQNQLLRDQMTISALLLIVDRKDEVIDIVKTAETRDDAIRALSKTFDITLSQATAISRAPIDKLVKSSKEELYKQREENAQKIVDVNNQFTRVPDIIYNDAAYFRKKYKRDRRTVIPHFTGYIHIGKHGIHQFATEGEMFTILNEFSGTPMTIHQYRYLPGRKMVVAKNKVEEFHRWSIPQQTVGQGILELGLPDNRLNTLSWVGDTVSYTKGVVIPKDETVVQYVTDNFVGIMYNGTIQQCNINDFSERKTISSGAKSDLIYAIPHGVDPESAIVVYMSTSPGYVNTLFMTKIYNNERSEFNKLLTTPPHGLIILDVVDVDNTGVIINLPKQYLNVSLDYVYLTDMSKYIGNDPTVSINLRSGNYQLNTGETERPTRHSDCSSMVVL